MIFYALHLPNIEQDRVELLKAACAKLKIKFRTLDPFSFDFSRPSPVQKGDILYRVSRGKLLRALEDYVLRDGVTTFYKNVSSRVSDPFVLEKNAVATPKSILCLTSRRSLLTGYVKQLGGFPIVIKALGGTRGLGVMKIDSFTALFGIVDYLLAQNKFISLRQFVPVKSSARLIVLGKNVIGSIEYQAKGDDFRTNASAVPVVVKKQYSREIQGLAVRATQAMGLEFGGVDVLIDGKKYYVSEVNFPCNFVRAHKVLKKDIALEMVRYLQAKSEGDIAAK